jgi:hypothetical protein
LFTPPPPHTFPYLNLPDEIYQTTKVAKMVSEAWKKLTPEEKKIWEDKAEEDKVRYQQEKDMFKGTWKVKKRKDPTAPKRPSSAYLAFSNARRAQATKENPVATNAEVSKILGKMWRECPPDIKQQYIDEELKLREQYKIDMANWKKDQKELKRNSRKAAAAEAKKARELGEIAINNSGYHEDFANPTPLRLNLPNSALSQANNSANYSRLLAAAGMNTGLNNLNMDMNINMGGNHHGGNGAGNNFDSELAFRLGQNFAEQTNRGQLQPQNAFHQQQQAVQNNSSSFRSPLQALFAGNGDLQGSAQQQHQQLQQQQQQQPQQQIMLNRAMNNPNNPMNVNDFSNLDFPNMNMNMNGQRSQNNGGNGGEFDVRSLLGLNGNGNNGQQGAPQFNLGNGFF